MSDKTVTLGPWSKSDCDLCGDEYEATGAKGKTCLAEELICGKCATHAAGYAKGVEAASRCTTCAGGDHPSGLLCICGGAGTQEGEITAYHQLVDQMWEALDYYASPETYHGCAFMFDPPTGGFDQDFDEDHGHPDYNRPMPGKLARLVLTEGQAGGQARRDRKFVEEPWMAEAVERRGESPVLNLIAAMVDRHIPAFNRWPAIKRLCCMYVARHLCKPRRDYSSVGRVWRAQLAEEAEARTMLREVVTSALEEDQEGDVVDVVVKVLDSWRPAGGLQVSQDTVNTPNADGQRVEVDLVEYKDLQAQSQELADMKRQLQRMMQDPKE